MSSVSHGGQLLLHAVHSREVLARLTPEEWDLLVPAAEQSRLSARLAADVNDLGPLQTLPDWARDRLTSARIRGQEFERVIRWEIDRVHRAFRGTDLRPVFLKGTGYVAADLPFAVGRAVADVDILLPETALPEAESALQAHGWAFVQQSAYDQRYYRRWMHELPPMRHAERGTVLDVHHAILPRTSRLQADSGVLFNRAIPAGRAHVLSPAHMVLHAAVHLFHDGEVGGALRDLVDLDGLLRHFPTAEADFWETLVGQARELALGRPVFYALRYAAQLVSTPIPPEIWTQIRPWQPPAQVLTLMDSLVAQTLAGAPGRRADLSAFALYVRSHWLRMPPLMLVRHLAHQAVAR